MKLTFATYLALLTFPCSMLAAGQLDQFHEPAPITGWGNAGGSDTVKWGQTFTVGASGFLTAVDVLIVKDPTVTQPLLFDIRTVSAGVPSLGDFGPNILASGSLDASLISSTSATAVEPPFSEFAWVQLNVPDLPVTASTVLALVLRSNDPGSSPYGLTYLWANSDQPGYVAGQHAYATPPDPWVGAGSSENDMAFRTYVRVPEPCVIQLMAAAIAVLAASFRRR